MRRSGSSIGPLSAGIWPVARMQAPMSAPSRLVETASREPLGMRLTLLTSSKPRPGPQMTPSRSARLGAGALDARRHEAGGDDRRLQQAEIVAAEVEHLVEFAHLGCGLEVDARQADDGFVDDAEIRLDRRARAGVAAVHAEVDGDVEHARALGEIHPEEEDVAPAAVGEIHAHGRALAQDRMRRVAAGAQQLGPHAQRLVERMAEAEHPRIAPRGADGVAHLVGQRLEAEGVVGGREGAGKGFVCALRAPARAGTR